MGICLKNVLVQGELLAHKSDNIKEVEEKFASEIIQIATKHNPNFDEVRSASTDALFSYSEFFAEAFANSQLGKPNELGRAMNEWLRMRGF